MWTKSLVVAYSFLHMGRSAIAGYPQGKYSDILNVSGC